MPKIIVVNDLFKLSLNSYATKDTICVLFIIEKTMFRSVFANNSVFNLHFMKVSTENDNNFGYKKIRLW